MSLSTFLNSSLVSEWQTLPGVRAQVRALERAMPQEEGGTENTFLSFTTCSCANSSTCISFPDMSPDLLAGEWNEIWEYRNLHYCWDSSSQVCLKTKVERWKATVDGRKARLESKTRTEIERQKRKLWVAILDIMAFLCFCGLPSLIVNTFIALSFFFS